MLFYYSTHLSAFKTVHKIQDEAEVVYFVPFPFQVIYFVPFYTLFLKWYMHLFDRCRPTTTIKLSDLWQAGGRCGR
jgi:hypothetical protein